MEELIRLLPDGASAVAVIFVVMLFLKQQDKINTAVESLTKVFHDRVSESQKAYQDQVIELNARQSANQKLYQDQVQTLMDAHLKVSRETILALKSLETSLREARDRGQIKIVKG